MDKSCLYRRAEKKALEVAEERHLMIMALRRETDEARIRLQRELGLLNEPSLGAPVCDRSTCDLVSHCSHT